MPETKTHDVNFIIGGLLLFCFSNRNRNCEIKIHTAVEDHVMKIEVSADGKIVYSNHRDPFDKDRLIDFHPLSIFVAHSDSMEPIGNDAEQGDSFHRILNLEGEHFYRRLLEFKQEAHYAASLYLNNGDVNGGDEALDCYCVKEKHFVDLDFHDTKATVWDAFVERAQQDDPRSIKQIGLVKNSHSTINLKKGQVLRFTYGDKKTDLFVPLPYGPKYKIKITYEDLKRPTNLSECIGFAHHCRAFKLKNTESVFGLFHLEFDSDGNGLSMPGCCFVAGITPGPI